MGVETLPEGLLNRIEEAVENVREATSVRVISHYDADGISSAGVLCNALIRSGIAFHATMTKSLESETISELSDIPHETLIFSDMGSGQLEGLERLDAKVIVIDHHSPPRDSEKVIHINPHLWGFDGMTDASASAMCMIFAVTMDDRYWDLLPIAFAGIVGDRQHLRGLRGINHYLFERGREKGMVSLGNRSLIPEGPLEEELMNTFEPYILGVSGSLDGVREMLRSAGIGPHTLGRDLEDAQRRKLSSLINLMLLEQGVEAHTLMELTGERYHFPSWDTDAADLASLLNACGRTNNEGAGLALTLGDESAMRRAQAFRAKYRDGVLEALRQAQEEGVKAMEHIQYFKNKDPGLSGVVCGLIMEYLADKNKPTIALSVKGEKIRVSSRATFDLLDRGVNLSEALRHCAEAVGGVGGGHAIASGATLPLGSEKKFLSALDQAIGEQRKAD